MKLPWGQKKQPVLVVDDIPDMVKMFEEILRFRDYDVITASSGEEALKAVEARRPLVILLDIMMPKVDGLTVLMHLKTNPKTRDIPVIMLTALQQGKDVEKAFSYGADGYLIKPATADRVVGKIQEVLLAREKGSGA